MSGALTSIDLNTLVLWILVGLAAVWDLTERRVPNVLIAVGLLSGLGLQMATGGWAGLGGALAGILVAFAVLIVPFSMRWLGGGDLKLVLVCGAFLGWRGALAIILVGAALNGLLALTVLAATRIANAAGKPLPQKIQQVPVALAIAGATLVYTLGGQR